MCLSRLHVLKSVHCEFCFESFFELLFVSRQVDPNDPNGPELDVRLDELRANIRRSEISKAKYESRLECLRVSGAPVDEWLKEVDLLAVSEPLPRSSSLLSVRTDASGAAVSTLTTSCIGHRISY